LIPGLHLNLYQVAMKLLMIVIAFVAMVPSENLMADVPQIVKISGATMLNKILLDGSDPGVFQCLQCSFSATFQEYGQTGSGANTSANYASRETMTDSLNNPIDPSMTITVTNPYDYLSSFVALQINPTKDEAFIALQTTDGFNSNPTGFHAVAVVITTTIEHFSKISAATSIPVVFQQGVYSLDGLDQAMGSFPGTIQVDANE
jgi:hypothetical protein